MRSELGYSGPSGERMIHQTITVRIPEQWAGHVSSRSLRTWLSDHVRSESPLPPDPGPGPVRLSIAVPRRLLATLAAGIGASESEFLRRLIAGRMPANSGRTAAAPRGKFWWICGSLAAFLLFVTAGKRNVGTRGGLL